jgi:hypothetical protein
MSSESQAPLNDRRHKVSDQAIVETILQLAAASGPAGSISPNDVARTLSPTDWQVLMTRIRREAVRLAQQGRLTILRKGKPADPAEFKGVYRLRVGPDGDPAGEG